MLRPDAPPRPDGVGPPVPQRAADDEPVEEPLPDGREPDVELVCVNADQLADALPGTGRRRASRPYVIGQWAWETDAIPERWDAAFALVDEVWVYSTYVAEQIGRASPVPVIPVPLPVEPHGGRLPARCRSTSTRTRSSSSSSSTTCRRSSARTRSG